MRTLVITPCSAKKRGDALKPARAADLADPERRVRAEARLAAHGCPAMAMYTGTHHRLVMLGIHSVWERWGRQVMDLAILSGGYGLLRADEVIVPYDVTLDEFEDQALAEWVTRLKLPDRADNLVRNYDLVFYLLSGRYLTVLDLPRDVPDSVHQILLTEQDSLALVPPTPNIHSFVASGPVAARRWHVKAPHVRGFLFGRLCAQIAHHGPGVLDWLYHHPQDTERLFYKRTRWRPQLPLWQGDGQFERSGLPGDDR
jgi:hypothetical protein